MRALASHEGPCRLGADGARNERQPSRRIGAPFRHAGRCGRRQRLYAIATARHRALERCLSTWARLVLATLGSMPIITTQASRWVAAAQGQRVSLRTVKTARLWADVSGLASTLQGPLLGTTIDERYDASCAWVGAAFERYKPLGSVE